LNFASLWAFSITGVFFQTIFQFAMIPLMGSQSGARFVRLWGWAFILISLFDLRISVLPVVEALYWIAIFTPVFLSDWIHSTSFAPSLMGPWPPRRSKAVFLFTGIYAILLAIFYSNALLGVVSHKTLPRWLSESLLYDSGLVAPNVFDETDLLMGDRWAVIERVEHGRYILLPFDGFDGERLSFHMSDLLYFGNSLRWRRGMIAAGDQIAFHRPGHQGYEYAKRIALYDHRRRAERGLESYRVTLFRAHGSGDFYGPESARYDAHIVLQFTIKVGDEKI
jgi:hypothetical protein